MTILSKKKNIQGKQDVENAENQPHIPNPHSLPLQIANNQPEDESQEINEEAREIKEESQEIKEGSQEIKEESQEIKEEAGEIKEEETGSKEEETNTHNQKTDIPDDRIPQQCWSNVPLEERHSPLHNYEDQESGPSHGKRRHRASPLRSSRAKHRDRVGGSGSPNHCGSPSSPNLAVPGPSSSDACGYNSGDEYDHSHKAQLTEAQWVEEDRMFEKKMRKRGLTVKKMGEDGACLFRAVADQVYGDQEMHGVVRKHCMDYIMKNGDYFSQYVTEDFNTYVNRKRLDCTHGNHIEMQALSEMYNRTIEVFCYGKEPINIFHGVLKSDNEPIRLSYQRGSHYNSIVDPHKATIGVGLGLPSFTPGAADTNLLDDAIRQSEQFHIEQAMLEDKLRATDWEATNEAIEKHVAQDSYLQYLRDNDKRMKSMETGTSSSSIDRTSPAPESSRQEQSTANVGEVQNLMDMKMLPPEAFGLNEWDDAGILAQVIMESQREYLDSLKRAASSPPQTKEENLEQPSTSR